MQRGAGDFEKRFTSLEMSGFEEDITDLKNRTNINNMNIDKKIKTIEAFAQTVSDTFKNQLELYNEQVTMMMKKLDNDRKNISDRLNT